MQKVRLGPENWPYLETIRRESARTLAILLSILLVWPASAQAPPDRSPQVNLNTSTRRAYAPGSVSPPDFRDSPRIESLIRAGQIYLSLQDAIALALENNLDLEIERYGLRMATTDLVRAKGGGTIRGVPLAVNETPAGLGGPGQSPLITSAATGNISQTIVSSAVTDTQLIAEGQTSLAATGTFPFASGPLVPLFDPIITSQLHGQHTTTPEASILQTGSTSLNANSFSTNTGYVQGFGPGTQISAGLDTQYVSQNSLNNLFRPYDVASLGLTVTQPLLRGFGLDLNRRFIRIARNNQRISDYVFQQQIISTVSGIIRIYDDLVGLNEDNKVKRETLATAERLLEDNRNKVDQGTLAPIEATRAEAQVAAARQDLINSDGYLREQELILKNVLARNWADNPMVHDARIIPTDTLSIDPLPARTPADLMALALANRPEYQAARLQLTNSEISLKGTKNELLPELDLVGSLQNSGIAGPVNSTFNPAGLGAPGPPSSFPGAGGGFGTVLDQILRRDYPSYSIGINLTLPVRNRVAQADVARDELQVRQTQVRLKQLENQIRAEVEDTLIALERTRSAYEVAVQTTRLQQQSLEIEQEKFAVGLSTNFLVIQYQSYLAQARSTEVAALDAYAKAKAQFDRAVGLTLTNNNVSIDEALRGQVARISSPVVPPPH